MILVTGASGNVGSHIVDQLLARGEAVRVFTREPAKVARWAGRVQVAVGDFGNPGSFVQAVAGADSAFLMDGSPDAAPFSALVQAVAARGRPRVVFLSTLFADLPGSLVGQLHKAKEDAVRAAGLRGQFLRPGGFMTNSLQWAAGIKAQGAVHNTMGAGRFAAIDPEDIAAVAVQALTDPALPGEVFELTGGELLGTADQVRLLAEVLGRPIECIDVPVEAAIQRMTQAGMPAPMAAAVGQSFAAVRDGHGAVLKDTVQRVTGRPPRTFEAWARAHAARFA